MLQVLLFQNANIEYVFHGASFTVNALQLLGDDLFCLWFQFAQSDAERHFARIANETDGSVVLAIL